MTDDDLAAIEALFNKVKIHFEGANLGIATVALTYLLANWLMNFTEGERPHHVERLVRAALEILENDAKLRSRPQ